MKFIIKDLRSPFLLKGVHNLRTLLTYNVSSHHELNKKTPNVPINVHNYTAYDPVESGKYRKQLMLSIHSMTNDAISSAIWRLTSPSTKYRLKCSSR